MTNFFIHASSLKYLINSLDTKIFISYRNENSSISKVKKLVMGISQASVFGALTPISSSGILILLLTTNKLKKCLSIIPLSIKQCHRVVLIFTLSQTNTYFGLNITFIFSADGSDNSGNCSCNSCKASSLAQLQNMIILMRCLNYHFYLKLLSLLCQEFPLWNSKQLPAETYHLHQLHKYLYLIRMYVYSDLYLIRIYLIPC